MPFCIRLGMKNKSLVDVVKVRPLQASERPLAVRSPVKTEQSRSLWQAFARVPAFRKSRGMRHPLAPTLSCVACAVLAGAKGIAEIAEVVAGLEQRQLRDESICAPLCLDNHSNSLPLATLTQTWAPYVPVVFCLRWPSRSIMLLPQEMPT